MLARRQPDVVASFRFTIREKDTLVVRLRTIAISGVKRRQTDLSGDYAQGVSKEQRMANVVHSPSPTKVSLITVVREKTTPTYGVAQAPVNGETARNALRRLRMADAAPFRSFTKVKATLRAQPTDTAAAVCPGVEHLGM